MCLLSHINVCRSRERNASAATNTTSWRPPGHSAGCIKQKWAAGSVFKAVLLATFTLFYKRNQTMSDTLLPGTTLVFRKPLQTSGRFVKLEFQTDGNLVLSSKRGRKWMRRWASGTAGRGADRCVMERDGNLVLYRGDRTVWSSGSAGHPGSRLVLQADETAVIYDDTTPVWATNTSLGGTTIVGSGTTAYHVMDGVRRPILDSVTRELNTSGFDSVIRPSNAQTEQWPVGTPIPAAIRHIIDGMQRSDPVINAHVCVDPERTVLTLPPRNTGEVPPPPHIASDGTVSQLGTLRQPLAVNDHPIFPRGDHLKIPLARVNDRRVQRVGRMMRSSDRLLCGSLSGRSLSLRRWRRALWECGKRGFIAFSIFPSGRFTFLSFCSFFFLCGKGSISSGFSTDHAVEARLAVRARAASAR